MDSYNDQKYSSNHLAKSVLSCFHAYQDNERVGYSIDRYIFNLLNFGSIGIIWTLFSLKMIGRVIPRKERRFYNNSLSSEN